MHSILYAVFALGLLFSPYWLVPHTWPLRILTLIGIIILGVIWSKVSAGKPQYKLSKAQLWTMAGLGLGIFIINIPALLHPLPLYGDEDYHIGRTLMLGAYLFATLKTPLFWGLCLSGCTFGFLAFRRHRTYACITSAGLSLGIAGIPFLETAQGITTKIIPSILDYPFLAKWLTLPWILLVPGAGLTTELLFRMVPLFSCILLAIVVYHFTKNIFYGLSFALVPIIWYYSSILYLDITAVVLMTITLLYSQDLLTLPFKKLKDRPYWYALLLIGFIKETVLPFVLLILAGRTVWQWLHKKNAASFIQETLPFAFCVATPLFIYLGLRLAYPIADVRPFGMHFTNLLAPGLSAKILTALGLGLSPLSVFVFPGIYALLKQKKYITLSLSLLTFAGYVCFFTIDSLRWAHYSRFALFYCAGPLVLMIYGLQSIPEKYTKILAPIICLFLLLTPPFHLDGSKPNKVIGYVTEKYIPLQEILQVLEQSPGKTLLIGSNYPYRLAFYERKYARDLNMLDFPDHPNVIGETPYLTAIQQELRLQNYAQIVCTDSVFFTKQEQFLNTQDYTLRTTLKNRAGVTAYVLRKNQ